MVQWCRRTKFLLLMYFIINKSDKVAHLQHIYVVLQTIVHVKGTSCSRKRNVMVKVFMGMLHVGFYSISPLI